MRRLLRALALAGAYLILPFGSACVVMGQATPPRPQAASKAEVIGIVQYLVVGDLVNAEDFYHRQLGLESDRGADPRVGLEWHTLQPFLSDVFNVRGNVRSLGLRIPGADMGLEPTEFAEAKGKPFQPRVQDPGAARIVLTVRNINSLMAALAKAGTRVVTAGGAPVNVTRIADKARSAIVQDPNGFFVELVQPDPRPSTGLIFGVPGGPPANNITAADLIGVTVEDTDTAVRFYRDILGLQVQTGEFMADKTQLDVFGTPGAQYRISTVTMPGNSTKIQLVEFKGIDRRPLRLTAQHDPNAVVLRAQAPGLERLLPKLKANGVPILSARAELLDRGRGQDDVKWLLIRDPNNVMFQLMNVPPGGHIPGTGPSPGPGPRDQSGGPGRGLRRGQ